MNVLLILLLQTTPEPVNEVVETISGAVESLGGIDLKTQFAATISIAIGIIILVFVLEYRNWNRQQELQNIYMTEIKGLNKSIDDRDKTIADRDKTIETERELRFAKEDEIAILKRMTNDLQRDHDDVVALNMRYKTELDDCLKQNAGNDE